jgi:hypothetical protein
LENNVAGALMRDLVWCSVVVGAILFLVQFLFDRCSGSRQDVIDRGFVDGCRTFCDFL